MTLFHRRIILSATVFLAVAMGILAIWTLAARPGDTAEAANTMPSCKYIVGDYCGYVAVFVPGQTYPSYITETRISTLPAADRQMLAQGIYVQTEEELTAILEDYET